MAPSSSDHQPRPKRPHPFAGAAWRERFHLPPWWKRVAAFIGRVIWRITGSVIIVCALLVAISQTDLFRGWVRDVALDQLNKALLGKVVVDDLRIDIFRGVVLTHPRLYADGTTVLEADEISLFFDLAPIMEGIVAVNSLSIERPHVSILRNERDSVWNIDRIVEPPADTTTTEPPAWFIALRRLEITDGTIVVNDRTAPWHDGRRFDAMHLDLHGVQLQASAYLDLQGHSYDVAVDHLECHDVTAPLDIRRLAMAVHVSRNGVDVPLLRLVTGGGTDVHARAASPGLNVFDTLDLRAHPLEAVVEADNVWGPDLTYFLPDIDILDTYSARASVTYTGNDVRIRDIELDADDAHVVGRVDVMHIEDGKPIGLDIMVTGSTARYAEVRRRLRFIGLPELSFLGRTTIDTVKLRGSPSDSLWFEVHGEDLPGRVDGEMTLYLDKELLGYDVDMMVKHGRLDGFVEDSLLRDTDVNGRVMLVGSGVMFPELNAIGQVELDDSRLFGRDVHMLRAMLQSDGLGGLTIDTLFADVTPLRDTAAMPFDEIVPQQVIVTGTMSLADLDHPAYDLDVRTRSLDLQRLLQMPSMPTTLTGRFSILGDGFAPDSLDVVVEADVRALSLTDRTVLPFLLNVNIERQPEMRVIDVVARQQREAAPFLDARLEGAFTMSSLVDAFGMGVTAAIDVVRERLRHVTNEIIQPAPIPRPLASMDARLEVVARDLSLFNVFLEGVSIDASCIILGRLATGPTSFLLGIDTLRTEGLRIETDSTIIATDPALIVAELGVDDLLTTPHLNRLLVRGQCDTMVRINDVAIRYPFVSVDLRETTSSINAKAALNDMQAHIAARARFDEQAIIVDIDTLTYVLDARKELSWRMIKPSSVTISRSVYQIEDLSMQRAWAETVHMAGWISEDVFRSFRIVVENFPLRDIRTFADLTPDDPASLVGGLVNNADITLNGTWEEPTIDIDVKASDVSYNGELIGSHEMRLRHRERFITGRATITDPRLKQTVETLVLDVRAFPLDLGLRGVRDRWGKDRPIDVRLEANKLALAAIEPFLPAVERVRGTADGRINVSGTVPDNVLFNGAARFKRASFVASPTNMFYTADGALRLEGSDLIFDTLTIHNDPRDLPNGIAYMTGVVKFDGLSVENIDFTIKSPGVHVLNMRSQVTSPDVYGDVRIATRGRHLHFYGPLDAPRLDGDIEMLYGNVIFPKERSSTKRRLGSFMYIDLADSVDMRYGNVVDYARQRTVRRKSVAPIDSVITQDTSRSTIITDVIERVVQQQAGDFADILKYDLNVYISGRFFLTMVLGSIEILIADLQLVDPTRPLYVGGTLGTGLDLKGKVRVKDGTSTYKFWKSFSASGTLDFSIGGMFDPALDLKAVYNGNRYLDVQGTPRREDYRVEIDIGGTKKRPTFNFKLFRNDRRVEGDSAQIAGDALMMIIVGRTKDELFQAGQGNFVNEMTSSLSAVATSALAEMLSGVGGFVGNVQLDVGSDLAQSRLQLSGQLFGDVSYRVSGNVSDPAANNTFTLTVPMSVLGDADALKYFLLDVSRTINQTGNITRQQREWEIKFGARLP